MSAQAAAQDRRTVSIPIQFQYRSIVLSMDIVHKVNTVKHFWESLELKRPWKWIIQNKVGKKKMLVSIFPFSHNFFYFSNNSPHHLTQILFDVFKCS